VPWSSVSDVGNAGAGVGVGLGEDVGADVGEAVTTGVGVGLGDGLGDTAAHADTIRAMNVASVSGTRRDGRGDRDTKQPPDGMGEEVAI
jgi:hypothetical protein